MAFSLASAPPRVKKNVFREPGIKPASKVASSALAGVAALGPA